jgi:glycine cleavage system H lipoate-binding protein
MTILFVLLTFLIIMTITYYTRRDIRPAQEEAPIITAPAMPRIVRDAGFAVPEGYTFHPGHTWVIDEGRQNARIGIDAFAANLLGKVEKLDVAALNRWVRQGQKIATATAGGATVDLVAPVEGVVIAVNPDAIHDPGVVTKDPYKDGWMCVIKSPDLKTNLKNLISGSFVAPWMQNSVQAVAGIAAIGATADGGLPIEGMLPKLSPDKQKAVIREIFLTEQS